ncbi:MAG TPA: indolepyruvate oxidoreductase subunit beta [Syntrophales bacterium]|nr:indolepyruvate oxidoreductase subunit beta [Syntrophales bacterium]HOL58551.1 indolepyruvate oxidoreductase subunit beta [Syntrophales bacterium]HPO34841.1 indolepyruvate oxidoreductase subunit beta [Syntrophales bacterium]
MIANTLPKDPYSIVITGVGGQGNVMASRVLANMLVKKGFYVTIGETFGASQRGGSVMSHIRVSGSSVWSPQIPSGKAHLVVALEPIEAIRVLARYGNPEVKVLSNVRPIYPAGVIAGEATYPDEQEIRNILEKHTAKYWLVKATEEAVKLGNPILANIMMVGATVAIGDLPLSREDFIGAMSLIFSGEKMETNIKAFDLGSSLTKG